MIFLCFFIYFIISEPVVGSNNFPRQRPESICSKNATFKRCPNPCPGTCSNPAGVQNCYSLCREYGCECDPGYVLADDGRCILFEDCPDQLRCNDRNATYKSCPNPCPGNCKFPGGTGPCNKKCPRKGCECKEGYYLNNRGKCVQLQDCPRAKQCSANEIFVFCEAGCPTDFCPEDDSRAMIACDPPFPCMSGCICKANYLRLSREDDRCIPAYECPPIPCTRPNEVWDSCPPPCLLERCDEIGLASKCDRRFFPCSPRCVCEHGFRRNALDICVPEEECPPLISCGYNEMPVECRTICPPQSCDISYTEYACGKTICEPGCDCIPDHLRNASGICIPNETCPPPPTIPVCNDEQNEILSSCKIVCPPQSCESLFISYSCIADIPCEWGCNCLPGYLRNSTGDCIPSEKCPTTPPLICGENEKPSECRVICPPQTCESIFTKYNCEGMNICEPGCDCIDGYLRNKSGDCVPSDECFKAPPLICGENEKPSECRVICPPQTCESIFTTYNCEGMNICEPGCDCIDGYLRNKSEVCVPSDKCFKEPQCNIPIECRPTCAKPDPPGCQYSPSETNRDGCSCQRGFILSEVGGQCIEVEKCPTDISCNGDPNAVVRQFPQPCPSTCDAPDNPLFCKKKAEDLGCDCRPGYIRSRPGGKCILPENCECGNPCGPNGTFVSCKIGCPDSFCPMDDSRAVVICDPPPPQYCSSGCVCKLNYRKLSREDQRCIRSDECPPVDCTRPHECWTSCPDECSSGYCEEVDQPPVTCNTLVLNCNPQCTCEDTFFRDPNTDICVSSERCREINEDHVSINEDHVSINEDHDVSR